ncbi:MAG: hypothetical protein HKN47_26155 [Pirellulaceae bacterium]|nr:hypothetical protein [Pirellulaceae bacterium]
MIEFCASTVADSLALTLIHFVWQGFLAGLIYWILMAVLDLPSARARYTVSLSALVLMAIVPVVTFFAIHHSQVVVSAMSQADVIGPIASSAEPATANGVHPDAVALGSASLQFDTLAGQSSHKTRISSTLPRHRVIETLQPYVLLLWLTGVLLCGARLIAGLVGVVSLAADRTSVSRDLLVYSQSVARRMGLRRARVFASERVRVAAVAGFWKPVVLLPASWLSELPPDVLQAVIAHELAHIRRYDVWANLLQRVLETLLFYHPVVWWLSGRVRWERELCCDELAVQATRDRGGYVIALERVGKLAVHGGLRLMPAVTGDAKMNLLSRIQIILGTSRRPHRDPSWLAGVLAVSCWVAVTLAIGVHSHSPVIAQEGEGGRSVESAAGDRPSPEADAGLRRSPEAEAGRRRSPEADAGPRKSAERDGRRSPEADAERRGSSEDRGDRGRTRETDGQSAVRGFKAQTPREEAMLQMIMKLQREVDALRREVRSDHRGDGDVDLQHRIVRRDGDVAVSVGQFKLPENWERTKEGRVFQAYDKNDDKIVSLDEWLAMTNGNISSERRQISTGHFNDAEPSGDGKFTPAEFIWWRRIGSKQAVERARGGRVRDRDGSLKQRLRDGDGTARRGLRDGEGPARTGPRDGE